MFMKKSTVISDVLYKRTAVDKSYKLMKFIWFKKCHKILLKNVY